MNNIFLSYSHKDRKIAERVARALEAQNWKVFWDPNIPAGKTWREVIVENLAAAQCVVVLWSEAAITSNWVIDEAEIGHKQKMLIPVFIEPNILPPLGFRSVQAADLSKWDGTPEDTIFQKLVADISTLLPPTAAGSDLQPAESKRIQQILFRRQQFRKRYTLAGLTVAGTLGAAAGIFSLRTMLGLAVMDFEGYTLSVALAFGINAAILGAALSFGIALADQLWKAGNERTPGWFSWIRVFRRRGILVVVIGTGCFAASHTTMAIINGLPALSGETANSILAALGAGLGLSITLYDQPYAGLRLSLPSWFWRTALVALAFVAVQLPFAFKRTVGTGLTLVGGFEFYRDNFIFWRSIPVALRSPSYLALIDSGLVGLVLWVSVCFGIVKAADLLARSLKLIDVDESQIEVTK